MELYTIGFTKKSAADFFEALRRAGVKRLLDVRLNNTSQLAGFTKSEHLPYFLRELCGADYVHEPLLAPSPDLFAFRRKQKGAWKEYADRFRRLLAEREVEHRLSHVLIAEPAVLLCTEPTAAECHRRLVAEYLQQHWGGLQVVHL
jgi:uncharacterized protein (DUF488 family)